MDSQKSALGLETNITTLIGYILPIVALVLIFIEKDNKFVRFHSFQAVLWVAASIVLLFAILIIGGVFAVIVGQVSSSLAAIVGILLSLIYFGWFIAYLGGLIYGAIKSYNGTMTKLPVVGSFAEKWS